MIIQQVQFMKSITSWMVHNFSCSSTSRLHNVLTFEIFLPPSPLPPMAVLHHRQMKHEELMWKFFQILQIPVNVKISDSIKFCQILLLASWPTNYHTVTVIVDWPASNHTILARKYCMLRSQLNIFSNSRHIWSLSVGCPWNSNETLEFENMSIFCLIEQSKRRSMPCEILTWECQHCEQKTK